MTPTTEVVLRRFREAGLPASDLPQDLPGELRALDDWIVTSRADDARPYDIERLVAEVVADATDDYAVVGHDGHGIASWAMHLYVVDGPAAVFVQSAWGGVTTDNDAAIDAMRSHWHAAQSVLLGARRAAADGRLQADERLIAVATDFGRSRWVRLVPPQPGDTVRWHSEPHPFWALTAAYLDLSRPHSA